MEKSEHLLSIQQISRKFDIPKSTIRFWEKELNGLIVPNRTRGGQRRYTDENAAMIKRIKDLRQEGFCLAEIKRNLAFKVNLSPSSPELDNINRLAERLSKLIKNEVYHFLKNQ
jgi:DNA-binding transcriptional MerR regulator